MKRNRGFTLIELLVVVGIIAVLLGILIPAIRGARVSAKNANCMSNLHQIGAAMNNYAMQNNGFLPNTDFPNTKRSFWLWDIQDDMANRIVKSGIDRHTLYCPLESDRQDTDALWYFNPVYRVTGYFWLTDRFNDALSTVKLPKYAKKQIGDNHGDEEDRELVIDATVQQNGVYTGVMGGWSEPSSTNHLHNGQPTGGNVLYLDGHVENRNFRAMKIRATAAGTGGTINFWF